MEDGPMRYDDVLDRLRTAYDGGAAERDQRAKDAWRLAEREAFLARLREHGATRLLEIGAGTGQDSAYFQQNGLTVVATDLSPAMVARCRAKGLDARVADFLSLDVAPGSFDAVYAVNCLLHVPDADLPAVLGIVRDALRPGGLFYLGVWGGADWEGSHEHDHHDPPRYFRFRSDERLQRYAGELFDVVDFHTVPVGEHRFQALTLVIKASL
ncbi:methyltransferase domain-containing protein [Actinomycetes bacterium KLBMP 9797]